MKRKLKVKDEMSQYMNEMYGKKLHKQEKEATGRTPEQKGWEYIKDSFLHAGRRDSAMFIMTPEENEAFFRRLNAAAEAARKPKMKTDIIMRKGHEQQQIEGIKIIAGQMAAARKADTEQQTLIQSAIAVGYANAMKNNDLIGEDELEEIMKMITAAAEDNMKLIEDINKASMKRSFRKRVTA